MIGPSGPTPAYMWVRIRRFRQNGLLSLCLGIPSEAKQALDSGSAGAELLVNLRGPLVLPAVCAVRSRPTLPLPQFSEPRRTPLPDRRSRPTPGALLKALQPFALPEVANPAHRRASSLAIRSILTPRLSVPELAPCIAAPLWAQSAAAAPLVWTATVLIGEVNAAVQWAAPVTSGLYQVNVTVPAGHHTNWCRLASVDSRAR